MINKRLIKQRGITLIEVMVSMTLGVFFIAVAMQYLLAGQGAYQSQDSSARIQENSRFAMQLIREQVRLAGYSPSTHLDQPAIYRGACGEVNGQTATNCSNDVPATATTDGDRLALALVPPDSQDCLGNATTSAATRIANVFYVDQDDDGISSLYCRGFDVDINNWIAASQPLINGIDQMQVQYGLANALGTVDRYVNATMVEALNAWGQVLSVKVALLVNSGIETVEASRDGNTIDQAAFNAQYVGTFNLLDGIYTNTGDDADTKIRRVYVSTIAINNP